MLVTFPSPVASPKVAHHPGLEIINRRNDLELALARQARNERAHRGYPCGRSLRAVLGGVVDVIAGLPPDCEERPSGRLRYKTTRLADEPSAQAFVKELKADLGDHQKDLAIEPTFAEIAEIYQKEKRLSKSFKYVISEPIKTFGDRRLSSITAPEILAYKAKRRETVGDGHIRNEVGYIKTIRQFAVDHEFIPFEKVQRLSKIERPQEEDQPERVAVTAAESNRLWDIITAYKHGNAKHVERLSRAARWGAIAIDTGARKMAICTLRWSTRSTSPTT